MYKFISSLVFSFLFFYTSFGQLHPKTVLRGYVLPWYTYEVDIVEGPYTVYEDGKSLILPLSDKKLVIEMKLNTRLHAPHSTYHDSFRNPQPSTAKDCYYQGRVEGYANSFVALSNCEGYHGMIILNETSTKYSVHALDAQSKVVLKYEYSMDYPWYQKINALAKPGAEMVPQLFSKPSSTSATATATATAKATSTATIKNTMSASSSTTATVTSTATIPVKTKAPSVPTPSKPNDPTTMKPNLINKRNNDSKDPSKPHGSHTDFESTLEQKKKNTLQRIPFRKSYKITGTIRLKDQSQRGASSLSKKTPFELSYEEHEQRRLYHQKDFYAHTNRRFSKREVVFDQLDNAVKWDEDTVELEKREILVQHPERASNYYDIFFALDYLSGLKAKYGEHLIGDYMNLLQMYYDRSKLNLNVRLSGAMHFLKERMGALKSDSLHLIESWAYYSGKHFKKNRDIAFLMAHRQQSNTEYTIGRGYQNDNKCNLHTAASFSYFMHDHLHNLYDAIQVISHEIGHNIGMNHDIKGDCASETGTMNRFHTSMQPWSEYSACHLKQLHCRPGSFQPIPVRFTMGSL